MLKEDQKSAKFSSLMRCQTELKGAEMTADSVTEVEVGMRDILIVIWPLVWFEERGC